MSHPDPHGPPDFTPIQIGEIWENPATGERATILELPWKNPEGRASAELTALAGARVMGEHRHPALVERFTVVEGELTLKRNGQTGILHQGETAGIGPGVWHDWWNASNRDARVRVEITPGERFVHMIETFFGLARLGYTDSNGPALPAATRAMCARVQRRARVPFAAAGAATHDLCCARIDRALARLSRHVPAVLAHRAGAQDVAPASKSAMSDNFIQRGTTMQQRTSRVNASEETIKIGPLGIRFLLTGDDSSGSVSVF